jgi:cobalamin biosynthetic protein CobC
VQQDVSSIAGEWTFHGGRLDLVRAAFPDAPAPWIDLSTGISPYAWDVARAGPIDWRRLPDPSALADLEARAAALYGVEPERVCALPGSDLGLKLMAGLGLPSPVRYVAPGYRGHAEAFAQSRPITAADLTSAVAGGGTILFANPGNPDGRIRPLAELLPMVAAARAAGGWIIVDEAFADCCPDVGLSPHLDRDAPVIVLRSFGKFFGLAGLRLGFAIAPVDRIALLRERLGGWPLSAAAIAIGAAALADAEWIAEARHRIAASAEALDAVLRRHGLNPTGGCPLFRLVETDATRLFDRLARTGILTRPFDYAPYWLRIGLPPDTAALDRLDRALGNG